MTMKQIVFLLKENYSTKEFFQENIHIFEIHGQLCWNYVDKVYLNLNGEEVDPFH